MNTIRTSMQTVIGIIGAGIAYFVPGVNTGDELLNALISFGAFAPFVMILAAALNTRLQWEGMKAFSITGLVALMLGYLSYFTGFGIFDASASMWWHPLAGSVGIFAAAVFGFNIDYVKHFLELLFNYSWKENHV
jgi:hypothetical protein